MADDDLDYDITDPLSMQAQEEREYDDGSAADVAYLAKCKGAYSRVFAGTGDEADVDFVMADLMAFARYDERFFTDIRFNDLMAGRAQVIQRIVEYTSLEHSTLVKRYIEQNP
jgi:hypothetical protein